VPGTDVLAEGNFVFGPSELARVADSLPHAKLSLSHATSHTSEFRRTPYQAAVEHCPTPFPLDLIQSFRGLAALQSG
jgi:hypothetical protein